MRKQKKSGVLYTLFLVLLLIVVSLTGTSEAGVQLVPRVNASGVIMPGGRSEDYVVFGKYRHASLDVSNNYHQEANPTPILWRVMSADAALGGQKRAILLSHYVLDAMAYQYEEKMGDSTLRPDGQARNKWDGSEVQTWLNSSGATVVVKMHNGDTSRNGFLHSNYFSTVEKLLMLHYPGEPNGSKMTLPSGSFDVSLVKGELGTWFGSADNDANKNTRKARFKGGTESFNLGGLDGESYWTRSPASGSAERISCTTTALWSTTLSLSPQSLFVPLSF